MTRPITSILNGKRNGYANCAKPFMIQRNHPKFITKCPSFGQLKDRVKLTKIEFGTLSREVERRYKMLQLLPHEVRAPVTWSVETDSRTDSQSDSRTETDHKV